MGKKKMDKRKASPKDKSAKSEESGQNKEYTNVFDLALLRAKQIREKYDINKIETSNSLVTKK